ncbi:MAG: EF-P lysine aminoacylase EpmA [Cocleimonas sp.]
MSWQPTTSQNMRQSRATMNREIRDFFYQRKVLEVETPALSSAGNTDPFIQSFSLKSPSQSAQSVSRFLHTSPEYPMKRLLAAGSGDIYQICKVWREEESGRNHNPEFTLLEWYRVGFSAPQLIQEVSDLLHALLPSIQQTDKLYSYEQLFVEKFGLNPHISSHDEVLKCVTESIPSLDAYSVSEGSSSCLDKQALLDALLTHCIEPEFDNDCLTVVYDYPASQSALAKLSQEKSKEDNKPAVAMRFEFYLGQQELGNGYQEETSYQRNKDILQSENAQRHAMGLAPVTQDENFLNAVKSGIPESAGVAIGLDRVLMAITGVDSLQKVINFPWDVA